MAIQRQPERLRNLAPRGGGVVNRTGYVLLFATVLVLGLTGRPGPLLAAAVLLVVATTAHHLITDTTS
nr:MAG TPA: hypothetical protein [Caudoviricetes sp.]